MWRGGEIGLESIDDRLQGTPLRGRLLFELAQLRDGRAKLVVGETGKVGERRNSSSDQSDCRARNAGPSTLSTRRRCSAMRQRYQRRLQLTVTPA